MWARQDTVQEAFKPLGKDISVYGYYTVQTGGGYYSLMTKYFRYSQHVLCLQLDTKKCLNLCFYYLLCMLLTCFCFLASFWGNMWKSFVFDNKSLSGWIKKHTQCVTWGWKKWFGEEKEHGKKPEWIPLVSPTYQVISVLLHCLTAEKPHKTRGGRGRDNTERLLFLGSKQRWIETKRVTGH